MSDDRFDQLAKAAATTTSRGQALKLAVGGVVGVLFGGSFFTARAQAAGNDCLPTGSPCKVNGDCCSTALGNSCCCHFEKKKESTPGVCFDRDSCIALSGVCS